MFNSIKTIRKNLHLSQEQVSLLTGVPVKTLRNWEQKQRIPSEWTIDLVMDRLLRVKLEEMAVLNQQDEVLSFLTIKENISTIAKKYDIERIYLFGSYVKGNSGVDSDIDLYMVSKLYGLEYFGFAEEIREALGKKIDLLSNKTVIAESKIEEEIFKTGVVIYERR